MIAMYLTIGGAAGAICRYLLGKFMVKFQSHFTFPIGMLTVNISGALGLGLFFGLTYGEIPLGTYEEPSFALIGIGFFGAFTTFSTFSMETIQLLEQHKYKPLVYYILLSLGGSLVFFLIGLLLFSFEPFL
ncbi:fluoride efflux transporter CrcB [Alteribacillus sp. JSM 102045]|uniref:fluoride efflux transporter CrcB n=1 Tax=Alteribacillus sp. JSM 102045 TaxID=1562101 RepID=UPI0035C04E9F